MTLTDTSVHIAAALLGAAAAVAFIAALVALRRSRYQGPFAEPYAGFRTGTGEFPRLACEGHCDGTTAHEVAGDEATCVLCGTTRQVPAPDPA